jgi:5-methylcytosine-specific restriction endonuclease McrA
MAGSVATGEARSGGARVSVAGVRAGGSSDEAAGVPPDVSRPGTALRGGRVLVLNATYEPINVCTVRRAAVLVLKQKAEIIEHGEHSLHSERLTLERPVVIRLVVYVRVPRDVHRRKITRKAVLARDSWTCQYCGSGRPGLTVDHVIPRSRGGQSVWENIVASCASCNRKKGNRLPREARMHPRSSPRPPGPHVFIRIAAPRVPSAWEQYLLAA